MKKVILFALMVAVSGQVSLAQSTRFGVKGGLNIDNISTNFPIVRDGKENILGFNVGVLADVSLSKRFSLQPQLLYNVKGVKFNVPDHSHTIKINSIDLPIYAIYKPLPSISIGAGPNLGYNLSGKNTATFPTKEEVVNYNFNGGDYELKRFDVGVSALLGYEHTSGLFVQATYLKGLSQVANIPGYDWSHNVLSFSVGYLFTNKK